MPAVQPSTHLAELVERLARAAQVEHVNFTKARRFESDDDLASYRDGWMTRMLLRDMRELLRAIRAVQHLHEYRPFDVGSLSIVAGDTDRTWLTRCADSIERWLAENRT